MTFKGALRSHAEALELGVIDPRIRELVGAFNVPNLVSSVSSCEGHRIPGFSARQTAFVMFMTATELAASLTRQVRLAQMTANSSFENYWTVDATFNDEGALVFRLACPSRYFKRRELDADFARLKVLVDEFFRPVQDRATQASSAVVQELNSGPRSGDEPRTAWLSFTVHTARCVR